MVAIKMARSAIYRRDETNDKKLLANVGSYKKDSLLTPVYVAGEVALDVIMPLIMAMMIDQGIEKETPV